MPKLLEPNLEILKPVKLTTEELLEEARQARDTAEAKCRWIEGVRPSKTASELAAALPPDVLMHPMPFPDRLDYAAKMIQHAFDVWTGRKES